MTNIEIKFFEIARTELMKIKISERATHARNELLLQNVSIRVWQNLVVFSSVVILQDFFLIEGPVCSRRRPFQDCTEQPAAAVVGSNGLIINDGRM